MGDGPFSTSFFEKFLFPGVDGPEAGVCLHHVNTFLVYLQFVSNINDLLTFRKQSSGSDETRSLFYNRTNDK